MGGRGASSGSGGSRAIATAFSDIMDGKGTLSQLEGLKGQMNVSKATFTTNGNSVKRQIATIESGNQRIDISFSTNYDPQLVGKPSKAIETTIRATLWENGNAKAIRNIAKTSSKSQKNAEKQYNQMLDDWKKVTGQKSITF